MLELKSTASYVETIRSRRAGLKFNFIRSALSKFYNQLCLRFENQFFISFPKCGRTWLRFFLAKYIADKYQVPFMLDHSVVMRALSFGTGFNFAPHFHFTHSGFDVPDKNQFNKIAKAFRGKKIHFLIRDPRDVVISYYWHYQKRQKRLNKDVPRDTPLSVFLRHPEVGISQIIEFMNRWYDQRGDFSQFSIWCYQDFKKDSGLLFKKLLEGVGEGKIDQEVFENALQYSNFDNMRAMELNQKIKDPMLRTLDTGDPEAFKVRRGVIGGYRDYFSKEDLVFANSEMAKLNTNFGYSVDR